ncbi:hypothetical protein ABIC65_000833 [Sphingomonas trueperi]|uniref:hypothetical protein n=1 Tax=Sphingomonas trueperi TaxID=53317 RepID=UPI003392100B
MIRLALLLVVPLLGASTLQSSQTRQTMAPPDIADDEIVVTGTVPRCWPRTDDPQDAVDRDAGTGPRGRQLIWRDVTKQRYALVPDHFPTADPMLWQRAGVRLKDFVFRVPEDGEKVCIGARNRFGGGVAQLRRGFDASPYWGRYMILTANVAARKAGRVDMWIAAGAEDPRPIDHANLGRDIVAGGFKQVPISGDFAWKRVRFLIGPIPCMAAQISYGIQLQDGGDAWMARPRFVEVPEERLSPSMRRVLHGAAMLWADPICRYQLQNAPLYTFEGKRPVLLAPGSPVYPRMRISAPQPNGALRGVDYRARFAPGIIEF